MIGAVLLYNYYTSSILSFLINAKPITITTVRQLIDSGLSIALHNFSHHIPAVLNVSSLTYSMATQSPCFSVHLTSQLNKEQELWSAFIQGLRPTKVTIRTMKKPVTKRDNLPMTRRISDQKSDEEASGTHRT